MLACTSSVSPQAESLYVAAVSDQKPSSAYLARASSAYNSFTKLTESSVGLQYLARVITAIARTGSPLVAMSSLYEALQAVDSFVAGVRIIHDVKYLLGRDFEADIHTHAWLSITHNTLFTLSDFTSCLDFCNLLNLLDTAQVALAMGSYITFGIAPLAFMSYLTIGPLMRYSGYLGYIVLGVDCANRARHGDISKYNLVMVVRAIMEIAFRTFLILAGAYVVTAWGTFITGCLGTIAASLAVASVYQSQQIGN